MTIATEAPQTDETDNVSRRNLIPLVAGPAAAALVFLVMPDSLAVDTRTVAAVACLMAVWWMTEAVPLAITALIPVVAFPVLGVADITATTTPYAGSVIFLVLGGIILGLAAQSWDLHRRVALRAVLAVGTRPAQIVLGLMCASAFISMWVSNTATAVIMVPIGTSILGLIRSLNPDLQTPKLTAGVLLGIAYGVTMGSMATLIGQPPMALMRAYLDDAHDIQVGFAQWMLVGVPVAVVMLAATWVILTKLVFRSEVDEIPGGKELIRAELDSLGPITPQERRVLVIFGLAAFSWIFVPLLADMSLFANHLPWLARLDDTSVAIAAASLLFIIPRSRQDRRPLLTWQETREIPWGLLILFGGGLTLSAQFVATGLSDWIGESVSRLDFAPPLVIIGVASLVVILLTELTSNTATAAAFFPIMGAIAVGTGIDPLIMTVAITLAVSCAFMLPVATPSNSVAFATGELPIRSMIRAGIWLNIIGLIVTLLTVMTLVPLVFNVSL